MVEKIKTFCFHFYLTSIIILNVYVTVLETKPSYIQYYDIFSSFVLEYVFRVIISIRSKYIFTRVGIIDLIAISPIFPPRMSRKH